MPESVFEVADRLTDEICLHRPEEATLWGVVGYDDRWSDLSPRGWEALAATLHRAVADVEALPPSDDRWERLGRRVVLDYCGDRLALIEAGEHLRDINNIASPVQDFRAVFETQPAETRQHWEAIVSRLAKLPEAVSGYIASLEAGIAEGLVGSRRQVRAALRQLAVDAGDASPFALLAESFPGFDDLSAGLHDGIAAARGAAASLATFLEERYLPHASEVDGVGRERYERLLRPFIGTELDLEATYAWGWTEIERLWARAEELAGAILPGATVGEVIELLKTDPERSAPSPEAFVALVAELQSDAVDRLSGTSFDVPDEIRHVEVKLTPAGGALGAHYVGPTEDFSRPGTVWYSIGDRTRIPLYSEVSTAYHEGFPGHHLQSGIQVGLRDRLTRLHRTLVWTSGYGEGWALYAETLMDELGFFDRHDYELGYVATQLLRACRVVIDIGMHLGLPVTSDIVAGDRWTFEKAVALLKSHAFLDADYAESEVIRYLGWPGQAISYKVGERVILELRKARRAQPGFDLKAFHADVLGSGPVGLDHLRELVAP